MAGRLTKFSLVVFLIGFSLLPHGQAAGDTDTHLVKINVQPITLLAVAGASKLNETHLIVNTAGIITKAKQLKWTTNQTGLKITVQSDLPTENQNYRLQIKAVKLDSNAESNGWVTVTDKPVSIIEGISTEIGNCAIKYKAEKKTDKPQHPDNHTILYTLTE